MQLWAEVDDLSEPNHPKAEQYLRMASSILYILTGEKFPGIRATTEYFGGSSSGQSCTPAVFEGGMYNLPSELVSSRHNPARSGVKKLYLKNTPIRKVIEVYENGKVLPTESYSVRNRTFLRKARGGNWIMSDANELVVSYEYGANPPAMGRDEAIRLADQFLLYEQDSEHCILPKSVTSIQRQGVSIQVIDPQDLLQKGRTGIYSTDLFIKTYNPDGARTKSKLYVPGRTVGES